VSAAAQTKIFGLRIGVNPKILVGALVVLAAILFWYNSRSDDEENAPSTAASRESTATESAVHTRAHLPIRRAASDERSGTLRLRPIDATRGDIDPTLRLDLLMRLQFAKPVEGGRDLFDLGPPPLTPQQVALLKNAPKIMPKPLPPSAAVNTGPPPLNIPLKYYGFVKGEPNRGLFLDGDNVLVGAEGEILKQHYLIVELRDNSARLEDVQRKEGQTLPVVPVALP